MDMEKLLKKILDLGWIKRSDKILVVCGNQDDDKVLKKLNFTNYLITSVYRKLPIVKNYLQADAQQLPFKDQSFDVVIVNAGLHHCDSPHRALNEMYRVAKQTLIVHEAQDTFLVRLMVKLGIAMDYETGAVACKGGGLNNTAMPNFVYRWTKKEVIKTLNSYDPTRIHLIHSFSNFRYYMDYFEPNEYLGKNPFIKLIGKDLIKMLVTLIVSILNLVAKNQGNDFAFVIRKRLSPFQPWITPKQKTGRLLGRLDLTKGEVVKS